MHLNKKSILWKLVITFISKRKSAVCNMRSQYNFEGSRGLYFIHNSTRILFLQIKNEIYNTLKLKLTM